MHAATPSRRLRRTAAALALLTLGAAGAPAGATTPATMSGAPMLREQASVTGPDITLGDLFRNAGERADVRVARAPAPGERLVIDSYALAAIATAHGLAWQPGRYDRAMVERPGQRMDSRRIELELTRAVVALIKSRRFEAELENRAFGITLPAGGADIRFERIRVDERARLVTALVAVPEAGDGERLVPVTARLHPLIELPVLRAPVMPGTPIVADDLEWMPFRAAAMNQPVATDVRALVGLMPRRPIVPGEPVKLRDLERKMLVRRDASVTILLRSPFMQLTTQGRALEDAAEGSAVRVLNSQSQITVEGIAIGPDTVEIRLAGYQPAPLAARK